MLQANQGRVYLKVAVHAVIMSLGAIPIIGSPINIWRESWKILRDEQEKTAIQQRVAELEKARITSPRAIHPIPQKRKRKAGWVWLISVILLFVVFIEFKQVNDLFQQLQTIPLRSSLSFVFPMSPTQPPVIPIGRYRAPIDEDIEDIEDIVVNDDQTDSIWQRCAKGQILRGTECMDEVLNNATDMMGNFMPRIDDEQEDLREYAPPRRRIERINDFMW